MAPIQTAPKLLSHFGARSVGGVPHTLSTRQSSDSSDSSGASPGAIAGGIVGPIVAIAILVVMYIFISRDKRRIKEAQMRRKEEAEQRNRDNLEARIRLETELKARDQPGQTEQRGLQEIGPTRIPTQEPGAVEVGGLGQQKLGDQVAEAGGAERQEMEVRYAPVELYAGTGNGRSGNGA